jgi:hypothetical protein
LARHAENERGKRDRAELRINQKDYQKHTVIGGNVGGIRYQIEDGTQWPRDGYERPRLTGALALGTRV